MSNAVFPKLSETAPPVTRRTFLKSCGAALGAIATSAARSPATFSADSGQEGGEPGKPHRTFHIMPHSHIDVEWYWTFATGREWTKDILDKAMTLLRQDPDFRFTQDQVVLLRSYWDTLNDDERDFFKEMVKKGRLAIVGGMYVQPEVAEPGGESLIRQILFGQQWLAATLGIRARCGWLIDTFGQIPQLPQILRRAGYESYVFWRDIPPEFPMDSLPADFYYESPDGSRILTHWLAGGYSTNDAQVRAAVEHSRTAEVLLPFGSDVSRPTHDSSALRREMAERLGRLGINDPQLRVSSVLEYLEKLRATPRELPVLKLDFNPPKRAQDLRGTYDNRIEMKKRNRTAEQALYAAECLAAMASVGGHGYPQAVFERLWEKLLFTHFHDIIGGSHSDPVYVAAMQRLESVIAEAGELAQTSLRRLLPAPHVAGEWLAVHNPLSFARTELCQTRIPAGQFASRSQLRLQDAAGRNVAFRVIDVNAATGTDSEPTLEFVARQVPAAGYQAYRLVPGVRRRPGRRRKLGANFLENDRFRLEWDPESGDLTRLRDKRVGCECLAGPSNVVVAAKEKNPDLEGNIHLTGEEVRSSEVAALSVLPAQDGLALRLSSRSQFADFLLEREIVLYEELERIDFRTTLRDFVGGDVLINVSFAPRLDWAHVQTVYETPFAATPRPAGHFAAQTWVDCSDGHRGVALLNRGTPGYWIADGGLGLVLLRSLANYTGYQRSGRRKGVPGFEQSTQTELAREHGTHQFEYALFPHAGSWRAAGLPQMGQSYNTPLLSLAGFGDAVLQKTGQSFLSCSPDCLLTTVKRAENGQGLIVRGYETRGQTHCVTMLLPGTVRRVQRVSLLEEPSETLPVSRRRVKLICRPHEIFTLSLHW